LYPDRLLRAGDALVLRGEPLPAGDDLPLRAGEPVSAAGLLPVGGGDAPLLPLAGGEPPWRGRDGSLRRA
jgi:hypothetical protein